MTVEPALAALGAGMDASWKDAFDAALPAAVAFVARLPLVRVVVPRVDPRKTMETDDALRDGKLLPHHKSLASAEGERKLGAADGIFTSSSTAISTSSNEATTEAPRGPADAG